MYYGEEIVRTNLTASDEAREALLGKVAEAQRPYRFFGNKIQF